MLKKKWIGGLLLFISANLFGQNGQIDDGLRGKSAVRVMFYNVENLFDTQNDPIKRDDEFTPDGERRYDNKRKDLKLKQIAQVVLNVGGWEAPEIIGFCEIENLEILQQLNNRTQLKQWNYQIIHFESPDRRGIDVALFVRYDKVKVIHKKRVPVVFPWDSAYKTRDILWATLRLGNNEELQVFVNHWPSRYGGQLQTVPSRAQAAKTVKNITDSLYQDDNKVKILILGDFNDYPGDASLKDVLQAKAENDPRAKGELVNLMHPLEKRGDGTHKFQGVWGVLDQIIVSDNLLEEGALQIRNGEAQIFKAEYLLEPDNKYNGDQPRRTYVGFSYSGGYSDHLPIYTDVEIKY
jgi:predicted extracellular nuclease